MKEFPIERPENEQIIYVIGNTGKEQLAIFKGGNRFDFYGTERKGYYAKWWRELDEVEQQSFDDSLPKIKVKTCDSQVQVNNKKELKPKRKYTKQAKKPIKKPAKIKIKDSGYF